MSAPKGRPASERVDMPHSLTPRDGLTRYIVVTEDGDLDGYVWADSEGAARVAAVEMGAEGDFTVTVEEGDNA